MSDDLETRVKKFHAMELPGQPMGMHMGTSYLVNDLWQEVVRLRQNVPTVVRDADPVEIDRGRLVPHHGSGP